MHGFYLVNATPMLSWLPQVVRGQAPQLQSKYLSSLCKPVGFWWMGNTCASLTHWHRGKVYVIGVIYVIGNTHTRHSLFGFKLWHPL